MKLIANQGSELEQVIKKMWEQLVSDENAAKEFIKERVGVMPEALSFIWVFGDTGCFVCQDIIFEKGDWEKVDKKILRQHHDDWNFDVNYRTKAGKQFQEDFNAKFNHFIKHEPLDKFGIHMLANNRYWSWQPVFDEKSGQYLIFCSNAALPYQEMKKDCQFKIEP